MKDRESVTTEIHITPAQLPNSTSWRKMYVQYFPLDVVDWFNLYEAKIRARIAEIELMIENVQM